MNIWEIYEKSTDISSIYDCWAVYDVDIKSFDFHYPAYQFTFMRGVYHAYICSNHSEGKREKINMKIT